MLQTGIVCEIIANALLVYLSASYVHTSSHVRTMAFRSIEPGNMGGRLSHSSRANGPSAYSCASRCGETSSCQHTETPQTKLQAMILFSAVFLQGQGNKDGRSLGHLQFVISRKSTANQTPTLIAQELSEMSSCKTVGNTRPRVRR
jgi:hypothetical protein